MLYVHRGERSDVLADALGDVLSVPLPDPLQPEVVSVPTRGVERWLTQRLSRRLGATAGRGDGVCANLDFPFPGRLVGDAMSAACGVDRDTDPWRPERAVWPLLEVLDDHLGESWLAPINVHVGVAEDGTRDEVRVSRRFSTARHIADLFDRYAIHRPEMVRAWASGEDVSGSGEALAADDRWQPELWRLLRARIAVDSPAERLELACARLAADATLVELPERLGIFGLTRLPASYVDVLRALSAHRDVHLYLLHPSSALWDKRGDATNPLLRSWGRDAREMQLVIGARGNGVVDDVRLLELPAPVTLLHRIQQAVRDDVAPTGDAPFDPDDRSVQVHACHGKARQVEVVRDTILHLLADDPSLEPRDVIVMCPDIETFAPLVHATFGAAEEGDGDQPDLRVRLADRSLRQTNPMLGAVAALLALAGGRVTATEVLDFAGRDPVRRRFGFDDDDLATVKEWVTTTGIRWGLDGPHRAPFKLDSLANNTWRFGIDRVLVGVAMAEEDQRLVEGVLPLDDVGSGAIDLAGRFTELLDRLKDAVDALQGPMPVEAWRDGLSTALRSLTATWERDVWQDAQFQRILGELVEEATAGESVSGAELTLPEMRALVADRLQGRPTRANFRTGHLTVCTLVPMRSVPHRVVCLLGLDDTLFPRKTDRDGDDLVAAEPMVGDGDGRSEDRQLLLDALLAATDRLVVTYSGHDERTNALLPPAVPVGELLDLIDATVAVASGRARDHVVVHHPLQAFDPRNFEAGRLGVNAPWSFDAVTLSGARALVREPEARQPFLAGPLPAREPSGVVELDALVRFVQHPVRSFLRQRLGVSLGDFADEVADAISVELDALQQWSVGERVLAARLAGSSWEACEQAERARGDLPPAALADATLDSVKRVVDNLVAEAERVGAAGAEVESADVTIELDDGRLLFGTVPGIVGTIARSVTYSRVGPRHRLAAWVRCLALSAASSESAIDVATIGRRRERGAGVTVSRFRALDAVVARQHLHALVDLFDRGMREPLPLYCATSAAYATALANDKNADYAAGQQWVSSYERDHEDRQPEHILVFGGERPLDDLLADPRFAVEAEALWSGPLAFEELDDR